MTLQKVTGVQLATGFEVKGPGSDNSLVGDFKKMDNDKNEVNSKGEKNDPNILALVALGLGVIAFVLSLVDSKGAISGRSNNRSFGCCCLDRCNDRYKTKSKSGYSGHNR